ncbi:hypothetical protein Mal35_20440 [Gimesia maris]|uniref:polymorphic toxin-type HINT domain-containing protein n=1 Tax=Gimesia maris TaxID=122 RepID=UPI001188E045|nr:polymorphic toxin-type HINT domain-containing protein [Gimesia maris]QDT78595.1 hypothetical protein Mal35_20440 [Gimesia maris]|tara:strand:+ start:1574 stop:2812 length:1239 start_codon:yes stop_codon:yes gene_type:complete
MSDLTRKLAIFSCFLFTGFCFWKAGMGLIGGADTEILPSAQAAISPSFSPPRVVTTPIQQMRPGMRIVGRNPLRIQTEPTIDPTPEGWRLVSVRMLKADGTYFEAELLRPLGWIRRHRAQPGAMIELNMPQLHVVGAAEVLSISACPPIDPGDGPVVISTFKNVSHNVLNIYVEGETDPIGVTAGHPIWSEDRQAFVHSEKLQPGERLRSALGKTVCITSIEIRAGPEPVYNLEVAGEHVYSVTKSGLLVHNVSDCDLVTKIGLPDGSYIDLNAPTGIRNFKGEPVRIPEGHIMSPRDPAMSAAPIVERGPFTAAQRDAMLQGGSGGTRLSPHHRHQIPTTHGGVIDELPGPGHPAGNVHTAGSPSRHPSPSVFNSLEGGNALRSSEIRGHWQAKAQRMIEVESGVWIDPGL